MFPNSPEHPGTREQHLFPTVRCPPFGGGNNGNRLGFGCGNGTEQEAEMETDKWWEYERRKKALGWLEPQVYQEAIQRILKELKL